MSYWAVVRAASNHERLAWDSVGRAGFETFVPRIRIKAGSQWRTQPLFGCYFFARVIDQWRALERSVGVVSVVKFGTTPAPCPDEEIRALLGKSDRDGIIRLNAHPTTSPRRELLTPGDPVAITDGPFVGLTGIYSGMTTRERELVLIDLLGKQTPVSISADLVVPQERATA
jgi:transcriptional antiterminator RfaH